MREAAEARHMSAQEEAEAAGGPEPAVESESEEEQAAAGPDAVRP
jgi:hypothetical protein